MSNIKYEFNCKQNNCTSHCCLSFEGISSKLSLLEDRKFSEIILTKKDKQLLLNNGYESYVYTKNDGNSYLKTSSNGICIAFSEGRCSINNFKPTICKAYPLYIDMFSGLCAIKNCPGINYIENDIKKYTDDIASVLDLYQYWIDYYRNIIKNN